MAKILIVEDDPRLEETYDILFNRHGHTVIRAHDGSEGLSQAEEHNPDVILLDMLMPDIHGIEFLTKFEPSKHPDTQIIVFSNMDSESLRKQAADLGVTHYEVKSKFSPKELAQLVDRVLAERPQSELGSTEDNLKEHPFTDLGKK